MTVIHSSSAARPATAERAARDAVVRRGAPARAALGGGRCPPSASQFEVDAKGVAPGSHPVAGRQAQMRSPRRRSLGPGKRNGYVANNNTIKHRRSRLRLLALEVPQPTEPGTPVVPDAPVTPIDPDPGTPADPEQPGDRAPSRGAGATPARSGARPARAGPGRSVSTACRATWPPTGTCRCRRRRRPGTGW